MIDPQMFTQCVTIIGLQLLLAGQELKTCLSGRSIDEICF